MGIQVTVRGSIRGCHYEHLIFTFLSGDSILKVPDQVVEAQPQEATFLHECMTYVRAPKISYGPDCSSQTPPCPMMRI